MYLVIQQNEGMMYINPFSIFNYFSGRFGSFIFLILNFLFIPVCQSFSQENMMHQDDDVSKFVTAFGKVSSELLQLRTISYYMDGSEQFQFIVSKAGICTVLVSNIWGTISNTATVKYNNCTWNLHIPGAFTPDSDGNNDIFKPTYQCLFTDYSLKIFNRFGQLVFNTTSPNAGWDGMFNNQKQPMGAYVWLLQYNDRLSRKSAMQKGTVLLIR